jgi:transposase-like protein
MDQDVRAFRAAAERENGKRTGLQRRYSPALRGQAVRCWRARHAAGEALRDVARALGIAPWSLHRWSRASPARARFHPVAIVAPERPTGGAPLVVVVSAASTRVEGLDVETTARLLALLR